MRGSDYQRLAMRTNDGKCTERLYRAQQSAQEGIDLGGVLNACLGLSGEVGETTDMIKKWVFHEAELDKEHLEKELGDVLWYVAMMCESFGFNLSEIMQMNIDKLKARYPEGFDVERANHRAQGDI
jgi:NTP pyrophosphatase (non-canonical NTP hydrolase)